MTGADHITQVLQHLNWSVVNNSQSVPVCNDPDVLANSIKLEGLSEFGKHPAAPKTCNLATSNTSVHCNVIGMGPYAQHHDPHLYPASTLLGPCALQDASANSTPGLTGLSWTDHSKAERDNGQKCPSHCGKPLSQTYLENGWEEFLELVQQTHAPAYKDLDKNSQVHTHLCMAARAKCVELCSGKNPSPETLETLTEGLYERMVRVHSQRIARDQMSHWDWASEVRGKMQACIPGEAL